jgi:hypothetical protein
VPVLQDGDNKHPMFAIFQQETTSKKTTGGCGIVGNFLENGYEKKQNRVEEKQNGLDNEEILQLEKRIRKRPDESMF